MGMSHGFLEEIEQVIAPTIGPHGPFPAAWADRLAAYLVRLTEANRRVNLISRRSSEQVVLQQLLPSLAALLVVPSVGAPRVLDIGAGGGFPGIPLAILRPNARVDLVESIRKKCAFLEDTQRGLEIANVAVHCCRIEAPTPELIGRAPFDHALARAVGATQAVHRATRPLLGTNGALWTYAPPGEGLDWPKGNPTTSLVRHDRAR